MAESGPTFWMFVLTLIVALILGYPIKVFLMNMMGIDTNMDTDGGEKSHMLTKQERNLCEMLNSTIWWVSFTTSVLSSALFMIIDSIMLGVLTATVLTPALWLFATTKVWPKVKGADFSKRFAWSLKRFE